MLSVRLNPINPKIVQYKNNGTSRDTYISFNSGGNYN